jgi:hydroxypyruvate reductase
MNKLPDHARLIINQALRAVDPARALKKALRRQGNTLLLGDWRLDLAEYKNILVVGAGKASAPMAQALEEVLGRPLSGLVVVKDGYLAPCQGITLLEASHPLPDDRGVQAGLGISRLLSQAGADSLIFNLISGGGSSLLPAPAPGITLADKQATTQALLEAGADINQINAVRKHLSSLKGGGLARLAAPARLVSLIISDVMGNPLDVIASGPSVADPSTWQEVSEIFDQFSLWTKLPPSVCQRVEAGRQGKIAETSKEEFRHVINYIIADNRLALQAAARQASALGYHTVLLSSSLGGDSAAAAAFHMALAREARQWGQPAAAPACLLSGGETVVTLPEKHGLGGRNQHFALAALSEVANLPGVTVICLGSDGSDGPTDAAGAWVDSLTWGKAQELGLDYGKALRGCDAYNFFQASGNLIITGPTNTNVMDLRLILIN